MNKIRDQHLVIGVAFSISIILALSTVVGGLFRWGIPGVIIILGVGLLGFIVRVLLEAKSDKELPLHLQFPPSKSRPSEVLEVSSINELKKLAEVALLLLMFDRTESGCWGKSYLYRRVASKVGIPEAWGSLTGTPFAVIALKAICEFSPNKEEAWFHRPLNHTLARILGEDGRYLRGYSEGQIGSIPHFEPMRHAAGRLLTTLIIGKPTSRDMATMNTLCSTSPERMSLDHAITARCLLQASYSNGISNRMKTRGRQQYTRVIKRLIEKRKNEPIAGRIWTEPYDYGESAANQWATVWGVLPSVIDPMISKRWRVDLKSQLTQLLKATTEASLLDSPIVPNTISKNGHGHGKYVFGTAIAGYAWKYLAEFSEDERESQECYSRAKRIVDSIASNWKELIEISSTLRNNNPLSLEGYFAWTSLCLLSSSYGIRFSSIEVDRFVELVDRIEIRLGP